MPQKPSSRPVMLVLIATVIMLTLSACAHKTVSVETDLFCQIAKPITWSSKDTDETIRQAKAHNAVGVKLNCAKINREWEKIYDKR